MFLGGLFGSWQRSTMKTIIVFMLTIQFGYSQEYYYYQEQVQVSLEAYKSTAKVDYYKTEKGILLGVTDRIICKITDETYLKAYMQEFNLSIEKNLSKNLYLLKVLDKNKTLDIANNLSQKEGVTYAHPDFIKKQLSR